MEQLLSAFRSDRDVQSIVEGIRSGMKEQMISGLTGSARQLMIASLYEQLQRPVLIVTNNMYSAQNIVEDLQECLSPEQVLLYPANELMVVEAIAASRDIQAQRIDVLTRMAQGFRGIVVTPYAGVRKLLPAKSVFAEATLTITEGETIPPEQLIEKLTSIGYERTEMVEGRGEMSVRGGIVDFFPLTSEMAYRVEWFDDEIESIRMFDVTTQRSIESVKSVNIPPCREIIAGRERFQNAADHAFDLLEKQLSRMNDRKAKEQLKQNISAEIEQLREQMHFNDLYKYVALLYPEHETLLDYCEEDTILLLDEPLRLMEISRQIEKDEVEMVTSLLQEGKMLPGFTLSKSYDSLFHPKPFQTLNMTLFLRQIPHSQPENIINFVCRPMQNFHGQMHLLKSEMERWEKANMNVVILANGTDRVERIRRILQDYKIKEPLMLDSGLQTGFEFPAAHLVVITEGELFPKKQRKVRKTDRKLENAERIKSYTELKVGDYVVHINHGIGRYVGIGTLEVGGIHKDYLHIVYSGGDRLSVPIDQIDMVQKYVGAEDKEPKLHKLGGTEWARTKKKARNSVKDIASDLVKLYAARQASKGYAFSKDTPYQQEFESQFPYEETPDQLRAIEEVKRDMEKPVPMDRLLCGDVGYGKTEVALRAAFKAVMDGKQVAVLVPTTILAQQHYETFRERFADFPVRIDMLSRFRTRKEQNETIKGLKNGTVDIVIGTHRLLSKSVKFKDLGLLVVDEEQRFGVTHKEKLKQMKTNVDVLTLTATPIPRTLHMSMLGVRDLSVIETPPENRFPVQTYVVEHSYTLVKEAIERELARDGQVYYLYNRVQGIYQIAEQISQLVPDARVAVCHGQMSEQELESTILDFLDGQYDVLVSTTIIETGVDIPNVNTLIVHDADKMGLSQLYQLRGRVGRSNRIAYAYFTYEKDKVLNEAAEKRLQAIKEFTELGSGFKIAMRDLAIRGAGNLLGAEQSGFIASVGFDLYTRMLSEEIEKMKRELGGEPEPEEKDWTTQINLQLDAYIPSEYIQDSIQKIEIYKKVAATSDLEEVEDLREELEDRFGPLPQAVENLLAVARLKVYGRKFKIESITMKGHDIYVKFDESQNQTLDGQLLFKLANRFDGRIKLVPGKEIQMIVKGQGLSIEQSVETLERFLRQYEKGTESKGELQNVAK